MGNNLCIDKKGKRQEGVAVKIRDLAIFLDFASRFAKNNPGVSENLTPGCGLGFVYGL